MTLTLRKTVIGDKTAPGDYVVLEDGRVIGRIMAGRRATAGDLNDHDIARARIAVRDGVVGHNRQEATLIVFLFRLIREFLPDQLDQDAALGVVARLVEHLSVKLEVLCVDIQIHSGLP
jgi:hypothetical protein